MAGESLSPARGIQEQDLYEGRRQEPQKRLLEDLNGPRKGWDAGELAWSGSEAAGVFASVVLPRGTAAEGLPSGAAGTLRGTVMVGDHGPETERTSFQSWFCCHFPALGLRVLTCTTEPIAWSPWDDLKVRQVLPPRCDPRSPSWQVAEACRSPSVSHRALLLTFIPSLPPPLNVAFKSEFFL